MAANQDIEGILSRLALVSGFDATEKFLGRLNVKFKNLASFPFMGIARPEWGEDHRRGWRGSGSDKEPNDEAQRRQITLELNRGICSIRCGTVIVAFPAILRATIHESLPTYLHQLNHKLTAQSNHFSKY
jgi:plasmid stabilization system protein ParE